MILCNTFFEIIGTTPTTEPLVEDSLPPAGPQTIEHPSQAKSQLPEANMAIDENGMICL